MGDPITNRTAMLLAESLHILVPVSSLFHDLNIEGLMVWVTEEMYMDLLSSDERFELYEGLGDSELFPPLLQMELRSYGLLTGPLVMLKDRGSDETDLMMDILLHLQEMNNTLETAWQLRPSDNPAVEAEILNLLMMGDMMEREIKSALKNGSMIIALDPHVPADKDSQSEG